MSCQAKTCLSEQDRDKKRRELDARTDAACFAARFPAACFLSSFSTIGLSVANVQRVWASLASSSNSESLLQGRTCWVHSTVLAEMCHGTAFLCCLDLARWTKEEAASLCKDTWLAATWAGILGGISCGRCCSNSVVQC